MAKTKEEIDLAWLPHALQKSLADMQHRLGSKYKFAVENPTEERFNDVLIKAVKLQNSGSRQARINYHVGFGAGVVPHKWLRRLSVTKMSKRRTDWDIASPRYFEAELISTLHDCLKDAVKHLVRKDGWEFVDCSLGFDKEGGRLTKVVLQSRHRPTSDGQSTIVDTLTIDYYAEGWL